MIAIQKIGKSFMGALQYNLKKMNLPDRRQRAEILASNFTNMNIGQIKREIDMVRSLRPNLNRYAYHTSLNFPGEELTGLSNEKMLAIAHDYLKALGFVNNQYFIFRHHDANHPHIHLLANRICFDGSVVSDSNNFKKSEAILRLLEYHYNLRAVEQSNFVVFKQKNGVTSELKNTVTTKQGISISRKQYNNVSFKAITKNEVAMFARTGKVSNKLLLQEITKDIIALKAKSMSEFIAMSEKASIHLLFNQASTGRVSGVTYFFKDFKAKGQALGNQFKWAELIKKIDYNEVRDNPAIRAANSRTLSIYGKRIALDESNAISSENTKEQKSLPRSTSIEFDKWLLAAAESLEETNSQLMDSDQDLGNPLDYSEKHIRDFDSNSANIQIADDIDDEAILGRNRHRKKMARTNRR